MNDLSWFRDKLLETYELKVQVDNWELSFLGRVIRITPAGIELEGDDKLVNSLKRSGRWPTAIPLPLHLSNPRPRITGPCGGKRGDGT